jgi:hypothetical protein
MEEPEESPVLDWPPEPNGDFEIYCAPPKTAFLSSVKIRHSKIKPPDFTRTTACTTSMGLLWNFIPPQIGSNPPSPSPAGETFNVTVLQLKLSQGYVQSYLLFLPLPYRYRSNGKLHFARASHPIPTLKSSRFDAQTQS